MQEDWVNILDSNGAIRKRYKVKRSEKRREEENHAIDPVNGFGGMVSVIAPFRQSGVPAVAPFLLDNTSSSGYESAWVLNQIPRGPGYSERIGRAAHITAVQLRGLIGAGAQTDISACCLVLVWDRSPNYRAMMPSFTDIFRIQHMCSQTNLENVSRFKILKRITRLVKGGTGCSSETIQQPPDPVDGTIRMDQTNLRIPTSDTVHEFDEHISLFDCVTIWNDEQSGSLPTMSEGALYLYALGSEGGPQPPVDPLLYTNMIISARVYYKDLH